MKINVLLIGGHRKAKMLSTSLLAHGYKVTAINNNLEDCKQLSEINGLKVINGDGTLPSILMDAGVSSCKIAIALTDKDDDNLIACQLCKKRFGVQKTISIVGNPNKTELFFQMGVDSAICAIDRISKIIEQQAVVDKLTNSFAVASGKVSITEVTIEKDWNGVGKKLKEISLSRKIIVGCILRGDDTMIPYGDTEILAGDTLILISEQGQEEKAIKVFGTN